MNRKGFTLTELLVVMVILGIITAISIPLVRNIQQSNIQKQYQSYMDSVKYGAKLYVDSYGEDLFGYNQSGCAIISYQELKDKNLIKDFDKDGMSCASEDTYVRVVKVGTKYGYAVSIGCGKKDSRGNVDVSVQFPREGMPSSSTCGVDAAAIMSFRTDIEDPNSFKYKTRTMKVFISSNTGVYVDPIIQYGFSNIENGATVSNWSELIVKPGSIDQQIERILAGETIEVSSEQIATPSGLTGRYYLVLRIDRLQDANRENWTNEGESYVYLGPYSLDNTKPEFNDSTVISSNTSYNALKPKLALKVTDEPSAPDEANAKRNLKMCISYGSDTCGKTKASFKDTYVAYAPNKVLDKIKDSLDGSMNKVYVTIVDPAGNYRTKGFDYELASVITYYGNGSTGGSTDKTYCNNNTDCPLRTNGFERDGYDYTGWYDQKTGGTKYGNTVKLTGNIKAYAGWSIQTYKINYILDGGEATNPESYTIKTESFTLNNPKKTGYTFTGWTGSNGSKKQKSVTIEKGSTGDKEYTAHYSIKSYTLTYDMNGHGSCNPTTITKEYNQKWGTLCSPSATGYDFKGWKDGTTTITKDSVATANITVKAQWEAKENHFTYTVSEENQCNSKTDCSNVLACTEGCTLKIDSRTKINITTPITANWSVEFYKSGTLETTNTVLADIHVVGGGGSGASGDIDYRAGGGGGGRTAYVKGKSIQGSYIVTVGAGGAKVAARLSGQDGTTSSFGSLVSAEGGKGGHACNPSDTNCSQGYNDGGDGGDGGSGGGASGYSYANPYKSIDKKVMGGAGGSDGSNGAKGAEKPDDHYENEALAHEGGTGQGTTTRDFGEDTGTLRAGGGGGRGGNQVVGGVYRTEAGAGGEGGGGRGARVDFYAAEDGDNHFGGGGGAGGGSGTNGIGGAGGSGVVIMRNNR